MRAILVSILLILGIVPALGDEWASRNGTCYDWQGYWAVERDPSGVWTGSIDFQQVGGACVAPTNAVASQEVRAVIVGEDFFARRHGGSTACYMHGRIRGDQVRGFEICSGGTEQGFALHFRPPR